jgi:hypothetical protein
MAETTSILVCASTANPVSARWNLPTSTCIPEAVYFTTIAIPVTIVRDNSHFYLATICLDGKIARFSRWRWRWWRRRGWWRRRCNTRRGHLILPFDVGF